MRSRVQTFVHGLKFRLTSTILVVLDKLSDFVTLSIHLPHVAAWYCNRISDVIEVYPFSLVIDDGSCLSSQLKLKYSSARLVTDQTRDVNFKVASLKIHTLIRNTTCNTTGYSVWLLGSFITNVMNLKLSVFHFILLQKVLMYVHV